MILKDFQKSNGNYFLGEIIKSSFYTLFLE